MIAFLLSLLLAVGDEQAPPRVACRSEQVPRGVMLAPPFPTEVEYPGEDSSDHGADYEGALKAFRAHRGRVSLKVTRVQTAGYTYRYLLIRDGAAEVVDDFRDQQVPRLGPVVRCRIAEMKLAQVNGPFSDFREIMSSRDADQPVILLFRIKGEAMQDPTDLAGWRMFPAGSLAEFGKWAP